MVGSRVCSGYPETVVHLVLVSFVTLMHEAWEVIVSKACMPFFTPCGIITTTKASCSLCVEELDFFILSPK